MSYVYWTAKVLKKHCLNAHHRSAERKGSPNGGQGDSFPFRRGNLLGNRSLSFPGLLTVLIPTSHLAWALKHQVIIIHCIPSMTFSAAEFHMVSVAFFYFSSMNKIFLKGTGGAGKKKKEIELLR